MTDSLLIYVFVQVANLKSFCQFCKSKTILSSQFVQNTFFSYYRSIFVCQIWPKHFRFLWFMPSLGVRSPCFVSLILNESTLRRRILAGTTTAWWISVWIMSLFLKEAERHKRGKILYVLVLHTFPLVLGPRDPYCSRTWRGFTRFFTFAKSLYSFFAK